MMCLLQNAFAALLSQLYWSFGPFSLRQTILSSCLSLVLGLESRS